MFKYFFKIIVIVYSYLQLKKIFNQIKINKELDQKIYKDILDFFTFLKNFTYENITKDRELSLKIISQITHKNITSLDNLYFDYSLNLGNALIALNKAIFYCEIIKCKKIFVPKKNNFFIRNTINDDEYNLTIEVINSTEHINKNIYISKYYSPYFYFLGIKPENRFSVFKKEILKNLPFFNANPNDLYIHIRSGNIFKKPCIQPSYAQPPLCFYKTIINNNNFKKIHIISQDDLNPVINKLKKAYKNIFYFSHNLVYDIVRLAYGYNIVGSISSFVIGIIKLNDNLRKFWEYDIYQLTEKIYHLHHSIYNYKRNYTIYQMSSSKNYRENMLNWTISRKQINIMLKDKCPKKFEIIGPNI